MRRSLVLAVGATALAAVVGIGGMVGCGAAAPAAVPGHRTIAATGDLVSRATYRGRTLTMRLKPVVLRAPGFQVLVQRPDGSFVRTQVAAEHAYLGTVDGMRGAMAAAIRNSAGELEGQITFGGGGLWRFQGPRVVARDGLLPPKAYHWPSASDSSLNASVAPGRIGRTTYRWDIGFDLTHAWFSDEGTIGSSVAKAVDAVELSTVGLIDVYVPDAQLRPAIGRVVIRADAAADPYQGNDSPLPSARDEWLQHQAGSGADVVALFNGDPGLEGVTYLGSAGTDWGVSSVGGLGAPWLVLRHELGHAWGADDNQTNGPEGKTIESGNYLGRFDGTEVRAILRYRDSLLADDPKALTAQGVFAAPVAPYAALDLVDRLRPGIRRTVRPLRNDHDANGGRLTLTWVSRRSHLGGRAVRVGDTVRYLPPQVARRSVDWIRYRIRDAGGRVATGVCLLRVAPRS